jgi:hypothetical protein
MPARRSSPPSMQARPLERLVRLGFATKGVVYGLVGVLALQAAFTAGGGTEDATGVLARIAAMPFGRVLLVVVAVGLAGYSAWRFIQAALDHDGEKGESDAKSAFRRVGFAISGLAYAGLAFVAARGAWQGGVQDGGDGGTEAASTVLGLPLGRGLLLAVSLGLFVAAIVQVVRGVRASFMDHLDAGGRTTLTCWAGRIGLCARGLVFGMLGLFLARAAWTRNAGAAADTEAALDVLGRASPWLFVAVATGFVAFALYCFIQARHRRLGALPTRG